VACHDLLGAADRWLNDGLNPPRIVLGQARSEVHAVRAMLRAAPEPDVRQRYGTVLTPNTVTLSLVS
jgi:hypothetical protein